MLYAGLAAGIHLPYECGTGTCGTCKAKLVSGEARRRVAAGRRAASISKQPGEVLMCQCVARTDCTLEVANFVYNMDPGACTPVFGRGTVRNARALTHPM